MESRDWAHLGRAVLNQRARLGLSQADVTQAGGPSDQTLRKLEQGEPGPYRLRTLAALERVLRWQPGAVDAILAGEDPETWVDETVIHVDGPNVLRGAAPGQQLPVGPAVGGIVADWVPEITSAGLGFLHLLDKHCAVDPDAAAIRQVVLPFIKKINEGAR